MAPRFDSGVVMPNVDISQASLSPYQQMASSCTGALIVSLFMTPLDVVKIRLQAQERLYSKKCFLYSNGLMDHLCPRTNGEPPHSVPLHSREEICNCKWYNRPKYFTGTVDAFVKISKTEGLSSLWAGLSPTLVLAVPTTVIYFTTYEQLRSKLSSFSTSTAINQNSGQSVPTWVHLTSGGLARIWAVTIVSPLELIRTKMQSQKMRFFQVRLALSELIKSKGIFGLWNGYTATLLRDVPFSALYWPLYEFSKSVLCQDKSHVTFLETFLSGAAAGIVASTVTLPFDVIKTMKQIDMGDKDILGKGKTNLAIAREVVEKQGVRGLFSGLTPRILKVAPACAIMISSYEFCKSFFHKKNEERLISERR
jgi:solute carrier family 25 protein 39/40